MKESDLRMKIRDALNALPCCEVCIRKPGETRYGFADLYGCYRGRHFEFEVKLPGWKRPKRRGEKLQAQRLAEWRAAGAVGEFVTSVGQVLTVLAEQCAERP